ncbi:pathogenicity island protein [Mammaliicoccus sciuri]|uniref:helix-turn-helix domain-containing protein n=1 Tax=Mammaliicoccus sciuri TaxID=1296 RepID=UPI000D1F47CA|nr:helix-turn-helix transcriptional regulator [Mammaliicoccus sciuri]PTJ82847.1 pathogenicity island protein [Mammaliicoccus sciuri]
MIVKKADLKEQHLKPKLKLREERLKRGLSTTYLANIIGLDRRQYEQKERGNYAFHDYEIITICKNLKLNKDIFFI